MPRILIVEDDRAIADLVALYLRHDGHDVVVTGNGLDALERFEAARPEFDLIVLDLMLPGLDGRGVARRLRASSGVPIVMLTALDDDRDKIEGLDLGADDYVTKPFNPPELVARVRAILRRTSSERSIHHGSTKLFSGNLSLDTATRSVQVDSVELPLRTKEFDLLSLFLLNIDRILSRGQLLELVWSREYAGDTRTVDVHVSRLRERLDSSGATVSIESVRSVGYRLRASGKPTRSVD